MANLATINDNILADSGIDPINLIVGTGTVNYIPKFTAEGSIGNSIMTESGANILISSNIVLHAGNYNNYAPTLTGGGASGTWGINISGNAATATNANNADTVDGLHASAFALTGGSNAIGTWPISITGTSGYANSAGVAGLVNGTSGGAIQAWDIRTIAPSNMTAGRLGFGFTSWTNNNASPWADYLHLRSYTDPSGGNDNLVMFLRNGIGMRIYQQAWGSSAPYTTYVDVLDSSNFNTWVPTKTGGGASGTWGISITGNADTLDGYHASDFALASALANYVPTSRTITINGVTYDLSANRSWTIAAGVTSIIAGTGIEVDQAQGDVRVSNTGVLSVNGSTGDITGIATTAQLAGYLPLAGGTMTGSIAMGGNNITNVSQLAHANGRIILSGNLHIDSFNGYAIYLQYYNQGVTTRIYGDIDMNNYNTTNVNIGYANNSFRAPIFYDSNDTSYYLDPNSSSRLNVVRAYKFENNDSVSSDSTFGLYFGNGDGVNYAIYRAPGSWTHPYPDLRIAFHTGIQIGAQPNYGGVRFYTDEYMTTQVMSVNNGFDPLGGGNVYVTNSLQAGSSLRAPVFYDSDDTNYYINPNGTSIVNTISGVNMRVSNAYYWGSGNVYMNYNGTTLNTNVAITSDTYMSAPLYYDSDNGAYYGNFAGTSRFNITQINSVVDQNYYRITNPEGGISANNGPLTGAIKIKLPPAASFINVMMSLTVQIYNYQTGTSRTIRCGGYNYFDGTWYNVFAYQIGDNGTDTLNVRFGVDGTSNCIWIGETSTYWSYPNVFITDIQAGHSQSSFMAYGWSVSFVNTFDTVQTNREAYYQINAGNIASQSVSYAASAGNADTVDGYHASYFVPTARTLTINGVTYDLSANRSWTIASGGVNSIIAGTGISVDQPQGDVRISNTGVLSVNGSTGDITGIATTAQLAGYLPLTGGTLTGQLTILSTNQNFQNLFIKNNTTASSMPTHLYQRFIARYNNDVNGTDVFHWIRDSWEYNITNNYSDVTIGAYNNGTQYGVHFRVGTDGQVYATNSFRAPIFYDSNDTSYFGDFNGQSRFAALKLGNQGTFNTGTDYALQISSNVRYQIALNYNNSSYYPWLVNDTWNGYEALIFHFNGIGDRFYFNRAGQFYAQEDIRSKIFYDSQDTSYYLDPNGTSNLSAVSAYSYQGNGNVGGTGAASYHPSGIYSTAFNWIYGGVTFGGGVLSGVGGINQNNLVGRPNLQWGAGGSATGAVIIKFPGNTGNYGMVHAVIDIYEYNGNNVSTVVVGGHNWGSQWYNYGANVVGYTNKQVRVGVKDGQYCIIIGDGSSSWSYGQVVLRKIQNGAYYSGVMDVASGYSIAIESDTYSWVSGDLRTFRSSGNIYMNEALVATQSWVSSQGYVTGGPFLPLSGGTVTGTTNFNSTVNISGSLNLFGGYGPGYGAGLGFENQGSFIRLAFWGMDFYDWNNGIQMTLDNGYVSVNNYLQAGNSLRAPIFYDSNDTYYYLDPNSTSFLSSVRIIGGELKFQNGQYYNNTGQWGSRFYSQDDGNGVPLYAQVQWVGSWYTALKIASGIDNNNPTLRTYGITQLATDGGGVSIGGTAASYKLHVYGTGYATSDFRAPIFYDSNDTGYYLDPNSGSNLYSVVTVETKARKNQSDNNYTTAALWTESYGGTTTGIAFHISGVVGKFLEMRTNGVLYWANDQVVTNNGGTWGINISGNAATASNASLLGGRNSSQYQWRSTSTIDMSGLDQNLYYPVTVGVTTNPVTRLRITNALNSNVPSWSTHPSGFTLMLDYTVNGSGWGTIQVLRNIQNYTESFTNVQICGGLTQMGNSSQEVIWLRGGGVYYFQADADATPTIRTSYYEIYGQSVQPTASVVNTVWNSVSGSFSTYNLYAGIIRDMNDTSYYLDMNSSSNLYSITTRGRIYSTEWIQFDNYTGLYSPNNGAHLRPNPGSYGPWLVTGTRNGWSGIEFESLSNGNVTMMINNTSNISGWHNNSYGWQFKWENGTAYVFKNSYGGGTQATVLDSSNYGSYALPLSGGTMSGSIAMGGNNITNIAQVQAAYAIFTNDASSRVMYLRGSGNIIQFQDADTTNRWEVVGRNGTFYVYKGYGAGAGYKWQIDDSGQHTFTGLAYFNNSVTAPSFFESSDARLKTIVDENYRVEAIVSIKPKFYQKNGKFEAGYIAQEVDGVYSHAVALGIDGYLNLSYTQVHTLKIAALEDSVDDIKKKIKELEEKLNTLY